MAMRTNIRHVQLAIVAVAVVALAMPSLVGADPDSWDPRLTDQMGVYWVNASPPAGAWYWRLVSGVYENEYESGGNHNIYYKCLDQYGNPIENQACWAGWPTSSPTDFVTIYTKGSLDGYWGNFPMAGGWCPAWPEGGHGPYGAGAGVHGGGTYSDEAWGMGMPCNLHVNYRYVWRWTQAAAAQPTIERTPSQLARSVTQGQDATSQAFQVRNSGAGTLSYTITDNRAWMSCTPPSGNSTGEWDTITVVYDTDALAAATYTGTITISDAAATNNPQTIQVTLTVNPVAQTSPGFYRAGWNMTSVPVAPTNPEASAVFQDLVNLGNVITNNLYRYGAGAGYQVYSASFTNMERGRGYWLWLSTVGAQTVVSVAGETATGTVTLALTPGWNLIGHPFPQSQLLADCQVTDGVTTKSFGQAAVSGWVGGTLYHWEAGAGYQAVSYTSYAHDNSLRPWCGYWVRALTTGLQLMVPQP